MPLKMTLEPQEWLMIGDTRVINVHPLQAKFSLEGQGPVLRQTHTMDAAKADTPAKRTYLAVQRLYLGLTLDRSEFHRAAGELLREIPSSEGIIAKASTKIAMGSLYGALCECRKVLSIQASTASQ